MLLKKNISPMQKHLDKTGYAFIMPNLFLFFVFIVIPFSVSLYTSFMDWDYMEGLKAMKFNGGKHYIDMWKDKWFTDSLKNTFLYVIGTVPITIFLSMIIAVLIEEYSYKKKSIRLIMFIPYISNIVAVSIVWQMLYSSYGPISEFVRFLGMKPPYWLADYNWALIAIMFMSVWLTLGYAVMIYTAGIQAIPKELYEAAKIDGTNSYQLLFRIILPQLTHTSFFLFITLFIGGFKVFGQIFVMTQGGPGTSTHVLVYYIYTAAFSFFKMGYASAISWVLFVILFTITLIQWKLQKRWEV